MRGIFYTTQKRPMAQNMELEVCHIDRVSQLEPVEHLIAKMVPWQGFGDDVFACRYVFNNTREDYMVCLMRFYGARLFFGSAMQPGWQERARTQELASKEN
ncbi:MAG: hypothetical protein K8T89_02625 [Planctomycetes bacterium]|nr:hypothetical protein [Planctomycetota bacterium]